MSHDKKEHKFAELYEEAGYTVDDNYPWCLVHYSQMMLNPSGELECVACTGNEIAIVLMEK